MHTLAKEKKDLVDIEGNFRLFFLFSRMRSERLLFLSGVWGRRTHVSDAPCHCDLRRAGGVGFPLGSLDKGSHFEAFPRSTDCVTTPVTDSNCQEMCTAAEEAAFKAGDEAVTAAEGFSETERFSAPRTACMAADVLFCLMRTCEEEAAQLSARSQCSDQIQRASEARLRWNAFQCMSRRFLEKEHLQRYWEETQEENEETQQKQLLERVYNRFMVCLWLLLQRSVVTPPLL